jgi:hypothetical protein
VRASYSFFGFALLTEQSFRGFQKRTFHARLSVDLTKPRCA